MTTLTEGLYEGLKGHYSCDIGDVLKENKYGRTYLGKTEDGKTIAIKELVYIAKYCNGTEAEFNDICKSLVNREDIKQNKHLLPYLDYIIEIKGLVVDYSDKVNLSKYVTEEQNITLAQKLDLMTQCADGIAYLQSCKPIMEHRSLNPENILVKKQGNQSIVQITDYYLSKLFNADQEYTEVSAISRTGCPMSYDYYFKAPESFMTLPARKKLSKIEGSYDIFSLGLVYLAMLTTKIGSTELKPQIKGYTTPIGILMVQHHKGPILCLFEKDQAHTINNTINKLQQLIDQMVVFKQNERLTASVVLDKISTLQEEESGGISEKPEGMLLEICEEPNEVDFGQIPNEPRETKEESDEKNIAIKFHHLIIENGPCAPTSRAILNQLWELNRQEQEMVLAKESIRNFLLQFDGFIWKDGNLDAVGRPSEIKLASAIGTCDSYKRHLNDMESVPEDTEDICEANPGQYDNFVEKLKRDKEIGKLIQDTYRSPSGATIYVSTDKEHITKVEEHLNNKYSNFNCEFECFCEKENCLQWLAETNGPKVDKCIGPGSFMMVDNQLEVLKQNCGNSASSYNQEDFQHISGSWGSIGCFAIKEYDPPAQDNNVYVLSAKHIVNKQNEYHYDDQVNMVSGFKHKNVITVERIIKQDLNIQVKEFVHLSEGYHGILGPNVDVALYGPLSKAMVKNHESFLAGAIEIEVVESEDVIEQMVMKYGARTGLTKGRILRKEEVPTTDLIGGTIIVVEIDDQGETVEKGKFADQGDSGSIVFLKDENSGALNGLGIVYQLKRHFKNRKGEILKNIIYCVRLNHCVKALQDKLNCRLQLYYHNFTPRLCLGSQLIEQRNPNTPATELNVTEVANIGSELCSVNGRANRIDRMYNYICETRCMLLIGLFVAIFSYFALQIADYL